MARSSFSRLSLALRLATLLSAPALLSAACGGNVIVDQPLDCADGLDQCGSQCVDLDGDDAHCGACDNACTGAEFCINGYCVIDGGGGAGGGVGGANAGGSIGQGGAVLVCEVGETDCGGFCANLSFDSQNCGNCFNACPPDSQCQDGFCVGVEPGCVACSVFITEGGPALCPGESEALYDKLVTCVCDGACAPQCSNNLCAGGDLTPDCQGCVTDTMAGCGNEFNACANDF